jgi:phosphopantetheinyl transferase (holo-ACP synthase)
VLHDKGKTLLDDRGGRMVHVSLSHTEKHATAVAILES